MRYINHFSNKKKKKGFALIIENILLGAIISMVVMFAMMYALSFLKAPPKISQTYISGELCGDMLYLKNTGSIPVTVSNAVGVTPSQQTYGLWNVEYTTLQPGHLYQFNLGSYYNLVSITGNNFPTVNLYNACG